MEYIATFYSHFAAMTFKNELDQKEINAKLMPVPRLISSSCGTCVKYESDEIIKPSDCEELEEIYRVEKKKLIKIEE